MVLTSRQAREISHSKDGQFRPRNGKDGLSYIAGSAIIWIMYTPPKYYTLVGNETNSRVHYAICKLVVRLRCTPHNRTPHNRTYTTQ